MEPVLWGMRWLDIATIAAIVLGPILAVAVDRIQQRWTERRRRRLDVFRALMKTRKARLDAEHVWALNLVDLEFYGKTKVMAAFKAYIGHLSSPTPSPEGQALFFEQREDLLLALLHQMGRELGYSYDKHDLGKLSYGPSGWGFDQDLQRNNMAMLNDLLKGNRALPVTPMTTPASSPFPPAPTSSTPPSVTK